MANSGGEDDDWEEGFGDEEERAEGDDTGHQRWGMEECSVHPCTDFSRPVQELEYTCLLKSTFTEASHVRGLDEVDFF